METIFSEREFSEEYLQEVLDPVFRNIALMEENEIDLLSPEAIYSGIMGALSAGGIAVAGGTNVDTEVPVPFDGKAQPGTEAALVADKILEIENRPISEAEKAEAMGKVIEAVAGTTGSAEVIAEAEKFKNIYEQNADELISTETEENVFGFKNYSKKQIENWAESKRITICDTFEKIKNFVNEAISGNNNKKAYFGAVTFDLAERIQNETGINVENYNFSLGSNEIRKIFKDHGDEKTESLRGQRAITVNDVFEIPNIIKNADNIKLSETEYRGKPAIEFRKNIDGSLVTVVGVVSDKHLDLFVQTEYAGNKKGNLVTVIGEQAPINTPKAARDTVSDNIIHPVSGISNPPSIGNNVFGLKAGGYIQDTSETFEEYRNLRDSGLSREETISILARKVPMIILSNKANDYLGKNSRIDEVLRGKNGIVDRNNDILPDAQKKSRINLDMQFFAEKDLVNQSSTSLKRGIRSLEKEIEIHKAKLSDPQKFDNEWNNKDDRAKKGLLRHWEKEIENQKESIENRIEELRKRGENYD